MKNKKIAFLLLGICRFKEYNLQQIKDNIGDNDCYLSTWSLEYYKEYIDELKPKNYCVFNHEMFLNNHKNLINRFHNNYYQCRIESLYSRWFLGSSLVKIVPNNYTHAFVMRPDSHFKKMPEIHDIITTPLGYDYFNGLNDNCAYGNYSDCLKYCDGWNDLLEYDINHELVHPETIMRYMIDKKGIQTRKESIEFYFKKDVKWSDEN